MYDHILQSFIMDEEGRWTDLKACLPEKGTTYKLHWIHFFRESYNTQKWLFEQELDELIIESLTSEETRPRTTVFSDGILLNLRAVNTDIDEEPYEMLSMRFYIKDNMIISTSLKEIHVIKDMVEVIKGPQAPLNKSEFMAYAIELITDRTEYYIYEQNELLYDLECTVIDSNELTKQSQISSIRRAAITFARYLSPQKDAILKFLNLKDSFLVKEDRLMINECLNHTSKYIENLESISKRAHILQDEVAATSAERMNKNMYLLSIIAAVFLPLSFLTGLLGVNLGGIPGASSPFGFTFFIIILAAVVVFQIILLRISRRF